MSEGVGVRANAGQARGIHALIGTVAQEGASMREGTGEQEGTGMPEGAGVPEAASRAGLRLRAKAFALDALLWLLFCLLLAAGFATAGDIGRHSGVSLRFGAPVSGQAAYQARRHAVENANESLPWPTFWHEGSAAFVSEFVKGNAACIVFSGDASLAWPGVYANGTAPSAIDGEGCAVSEALAWRIWGSADVVGMALEVDGKARVVRGVFAGDDELLLVSVRDEDTSQSWGAAEFPANAAATRESAQSYAQASGLGRPGAILMGGQRHFASALSALPLLAPIGYGLALAAGHFRRRYPAACTPALFACLIAFAALLPGILDAVPPRLIPTRWSDFSFWSTLAEGAARGLEEFLNVTPGLKDIALRKLLIKQAGVAFLATCCGISLCFRWQMRRQKLQNMPGGQHG